jgi:lipopolysaccharide/colanic/teichoic acid biosynthesis glycosyltransferase
MAVGSVVAGLAAYGFQALGGRALGDGGFAPVAALLSVHSLILAVLLTPVELLTVRRLTLARGGAPDAHDRRSITVTSLTAVVTMVVFVAATLGRYFTGDQSYVWIGAAVVATHALFASGRGALAGRGRYVAYGVVSAGAAVVRVLLAAAWLAWSPTDLTLAWSVALPPLVIIAFRPFRRPPEGIKVPPRAGSGALMAGFVLAGAISQAFVLVGPLVAGALVHQPEQVARVVSTVFVAFSLARAPLLLAQNLAARLLAGLTKLVAREAHRELRTWSRRLGLVGLTLTPVAFFVGEWLGPPTIEFLFGASFRPTPLVAGLAVAACWLAAASVFLDQVLIALGATGKLAGAWTVALSVGAITLVAAGGPADVRVSIAVLAGELAALVAVMVAAELAHPESPDSGYDLVKRAMDMAGGLTLSLLTLPLQLLVAAAILLESPGPVVFRQLRVGKNDRPFTMLKFRTMTSGVGDGPLLAHLDTMVTEGYIRPDPHARGPALLIDDDPRVTRVGRFLRKGSLDELPNLWNVVRGHMSLVGPRPLVPAEVELLDPEARVRHKVRPGLTGLAQVKGGSNITFGERAYWDLEYVANRSLLLDLLILAKTPLAAVRR